MGTSFGAAIDYLVASLSSGATVQVAPGSTVTVPALSTINPAVEVVDNLPTGDDGVWVTIGRGGVTDGTSTSGTSQYVELGAGRVEESYTIPCFVYLQMDGPAQKPARDAALALFDGVVKLVHTDPTLGGLLQRGRIGMVSSLSLAQTQDDEDSGGGAVVVATLHFDIQIHNTYIP